MTASDLTFGVEIECYMPINDAHTVGGYHAGLQIAELPQGWNAQRDGSIRASRGFVGVEVVSPVLQGAEGMAQLKLVTEWLRSKGARVNRTTGLHVHVGYDRSAESLKKIVTVAANFEKALYASTGTKTREQGRYCQPVQSSRLHREGRYEMTDRYHVLNVQTGKPTVEFRAFAGTTNYLKIVAHVLTCLGLVEKSQKVQRLPNWTAKTVKETSPIARGGEGLTALNRLFYWMGWTKGRTQYTFGEIEGRQGPKLRTLKNQLVKMARKYDAAV